MSRREMTSTSSPYSFDKRIKPDEANRKGGTVLYSPVPSRITQSQMIYQMAPSNTNPQQNGIPTTRTTTTTNPDPHKKPGTPVMSTNGPNMVNSQYHKFAFHFSKNFKIWQIFF